MTYNARGCLGRDGRRSPERIAEVIASAQPDVVCLQELDAGRSRSGRVHQARSIAGALAMQAHFHAALEVAEGQYGNAILSAHPCRWVRAGVLPGVHSPWSTEPRGALWVSVLHGGVPWQILATHLGLGRAERLRQARALVSSSWVGAALDSPPVVLCGDLNSRPASAVHGILGRFLADAWALRGGPRPRTFSTRVPLVCLDYIYLSPRIGVPSVRIVDTPLARRASDHFPVVAELAWGAQPIRALSGQPIP